MNSNVSHHHLVSAPANGIDDAAPALQAAIDRYPSIFVPPGLYRLNRALRIPSERHLQADPEARFILADGACTQRDDYLLTNADPAGGNRSIEIRGGIWNGNNRGNPRVPGDLFANGYTGCMFHFENVRGLKIDDLTLENAEAYFLRITAVRDFAFTSIRFASTNPRPNNDGIHLGGDCEDGLIRDIAGLHPGVTGDDLVALNADDALTRTEVRGMRCGPIRRIRIEKLRAEDCHSFVRLLSVASPIEDVTIHGIEGSCSIAAINCDGARGCRVPLFDEANPPFPDGVGSLRNIRIRNLRVAKSKSNEIPLLTLHTRMDQFLIEDFLRLHDDATDTPTFQLAHVPGTVIDFDGEVFTASENQSFVSNARSIQRISLTRPPGNAPVDASAG